MPITTQSVDSVRANIESYIRQQISCLEPEQQAIVMQAVVLDLQRVHNEGLSRGAKALA